MSKNDNTLIVIDNDYEKRYFYSANRAVNGLGYLTGTGTLKVYRLDEEATDEEATDDLNRGVRMGLKIAQHDPRTGKWLKSTVDNLRGILTTCTGIRRS